MMGMMGTREIRVGMEGMGVGMRGIEWNRNRKKNEKKKFIKSNFLFFLKLKQKQKTKLEFS